MKEIVEKREEVFAAHRRLKDREFPLIVSFCVLGELLNPALSPFVLQLS
jgi:hypothetical protein